MSKVRLRVLDYPGPRSGRNAAGAIAGLALLAVLAPVGLAAQESRPDREELGRLARVHVELNEARDEFHAEIGRQHEEQARERARAAFEERVAGILTEHELTREEYDAFILLVSRDADVRAAWEAVLAELDPGRESGND